MGEGCSDSVWRVGGRGGRLEAEADEDDEDECAMEALLEGVNGPFSAFGPRGLVVERAPHGGGAGGGGSRSHKASSHWRIL